MRALNEMDVANLEKILKREDGGLARLFERFVPVMLPEWGDAAEYWWCDIEEVRKEYHLEFTWNGESFLGADANKD